MSIETPEHKQFLGNIQALRGIAALLVVVSHLFVMEQKYSPDQFLNSLTSFGFLGVDIFFVLSGFIMVHVVKRLERGIKASLEFLYARITRIYPLYWIVSIPVLALFLIKPEMVFASYSTAPNITKSLFLFPDVRDPLLAVGWTLIHEMGFYLVFSLTLLFKQKWLFHFIWLWYMVLILGQISGIADLNPVLSVFFSPLSFEFLCGACVGILYHKFNGKAAASSLIFGALLLLMPIFLFAMTNGSMTQIPLDRALYFSIPIGLCVYGLAGLPNFMPSCMQTLGNWSYALYLTHILSLSLVGRMWQKHAHQHIWDNIIVLILMLITSIFVAGLAHKFAEKPILTFTKNARGRLFR